MGCAPTYVDVSGETLLCRHSGSTTHTYTFACTHTTPLPTPPTTQRSLPPPSCVALQHAVWFRLTITPVTLLLTSSALPCALPPCPPPPLSDSVATFLEANGRGYWEADEEKLERLRQMYMDVEDKIEGELIV